MNRLLRRIAYLMRWRQREAELVEEMRFHRELSGDRAFGNEPLARNRARDVWVAPWLQDISQDVRFAARMLAKDKRFTIAAVLALALGIGVNSSVFTIINAVMLDKVPFENARQLVAVGTVTPRGQPAGVSMPEYRELRERINAFEDVAATVGGAMNLAEEGRFPERLRGSYISANAFRLLRTRPVAGRDFTAEDDRQDAPPVAIIGYDVWVDRYAADPAAIGRAVKINGTAATIVGVMPAGFNYPMAEVWLPLAQFGSPRSSPPATPTRTLNVIARLKGDRSQASGEIEALNAVLTRERPDTNRDVRFVVRGLTENVARQSMPMLFTMLAAVVMVLLVACANLANLLLARSSARGREIAIRASIGASRWRIVRQLLIECAVLGAIAGLLGHAFSYFGAQQIARAFDAREPGAGAAAMPPWWLDTSPNLYDYAFVGMVCVFAVLAFGLVPSLHMAKINVHDSLKEGGRSTGGVRTRRWTAGLMVAEVALTFILLAAAGLLWRSFLDQYRADVGFDTANVVIMSIALPPSGYGAPEERQQFFDRLQERVNAISTLESATIATQLPLVFFPTPSRHVIFDGVPQSAAATPMATPVFVGLRFFETLGVRPVAGRFLEPSDAAAGREGVVVNERVASALFADRSALGQRIRLLSGPANTLTPALTIVGVAPNLDRPGPSDRRSMLVYIPARLEPPARAFIAARGRDGTTAAAVTLREEVRAIDPDLPLFGIEPYESALDRSLDAVEMVGSWFSVIAIATLTVAALGLFALTAHGVAQRKQEIGVRVALGAPPVSVIWMFMKSTVLQLVCGLVVGIYGAINVGRFLQGYLGGVSPGDALTIVLVASVLVGVALLATLFAARRAALVDPVQALRTD